MFKISNIEYGMHSIYLVIEDCIKNLNKFLFVGAGAFLVPIFYAISFFDKSIVTKSAIFTYWLLISIFIYYPSVLSHDSLFKCLSSFATDFLEIIIKNLN